MIPAVAFSDFPELFLGFSKQIPYVAPLQVVRTVYFVPFGHVGMVWKKEKEYSQEEILEWKKLSF